MSAVRLTPTRAPTRRPTRSSPAKNKPTRCAMWPGTLSVSGRTELRDALGSSLGQPSERLLCANGSTRSCRRLLLTYAAEPTAARSSSSRPTRCTRTSRRSPTPRIVAGERRADSYTVDPDAAIALVAQHAAGARVLVQSQQPHRHRRAARDSRTLLALADEIGAPADRRRGVRPSSDAVERPRARRRRPAPRGRADLFEGLGPSPRCGWVCGRAVVGDRRAREGAAALRAVGADPARGHDRAGLPDRDATPRRGVGGGAGPHLWALAELPGLSVVPSGANFLLVRVSGDAHDLWRAPARARRARARLLEPPRSRGMFSASRSGARRRTTSSWPRSASALPEVVR